MTDLRAVRRRARQDQETRALAAHGARDAIRLHTHPDGSVTLESLAGARITLSRGAALYLAAKILVATDEG